MMFPCVVGRPSSCFDGKLLLWRVSKPYIAKRSSVHHQAGEEYEKDCTLDGALFKKIMLEQLFPAALKTFPNAETINIQLDNAPGHSFVEETNDYGSRIRPQIHLIKQPPNSPDMNVLDLGFFYSLGCRVSRKNESSGHDA